MRTIPTGRGGATGPPGIQGPAGASGLTAKLAAIIANGHAAADITGWFSQAAAAPTVFATLIYKDTTLITGGTYVWSGTAYVKIT